MQLLLQRAVKRNKPTHACLCLATCGARERVEHQTALLQECRRKRRSKRREAGRLSSGIHGLLGLDLLGRILSVSPQLGQRGLPALEGGLLWDLRPSFDKDLVGELRRSPSSSIAEGHPVIAIVVEEAVDVRLIQFDRTFSSRVTQKQQVGRCDPARSPVRHWIKVSTTILARQGSSAERRWPRVQHIAAKSFPRRDERGAARRTLRRRAAVEQTPRAGGAERVRGHGRGCPP